MYLLNIVLGVLGLIGWCWVWFIAKYQTGCAARIQWGVILLGTVLTLILLADILQNRTPTSFSVTARILFITALYLLTPLLKVDAETLKRSCK